MDLTLVVNGERRSLRIDPRTTLLDLLRENLGLTGTKHTDRRLPDTGHAGELAPYFFCSRSYLPEESADRFRAEGAGVEDAIPKLSYQRGHPGGRGGNIQWDRGIKAYEPAVAIEKTNLAPQSLRLLHRFARA